MDSPLPSGPKAGDRRAYSFKFEGKVVAPANDTDGQYGIIEGYAATFGNVDLGGEVIDAGAFSKTIKESIPKRAVKLLATHLAHGASVTEVIGTLVEAREDDHGLWIRAILASTQTAQDVRTLVQEGHVSGLSIGFEMLRWEVVHEDDKDVLHHKEVRLLEVTVTAYPMNPEAVITAAKSFECVATSIRNRVAAAKPEDRAAVVAALCGKDAGWDTLRSAVEDLSAVLRELGTLEAPVATTETASVVPVAGVGLAAKELDVRKRKVEALRFELNRC